MGSQPHAQELMLVHEDSVVQIVRFERTQLFIEQALGIRIIGAIALI